MEFARISRLKEMPEGRLSNKGKVVDHAADGVKRSEFDMAIRV